MSDPLKPIHQAIEFIEEHLHEEITVANMAAAATGQKTLELEKDEQVQEVKVIQDSLPNIPKTDDQQVDPVIAQLTNIQSDAPPCGTCGHTTVRNGTCYKCLNCGSTTGCS